MRSLPQMDACCSSARLPSSEETRRSTGCCPGKESQMESPPNSSGTGPVSRLFWSISSSKLVKFPSSAGTGPLKWLLARRGK